MNNKHGMLLTVTVAIGAILATSAPARAANDPPPPGAIFDLGGGETGTAPVPVNLIIGSDPSEVMPGVTPAFASADFTASSASTDIALAMRDDPAGLIVFDVAVTDLTHPSSSTLLTNGNFASGLSSWTVFTSPDTDGSIGALTGCGSFPGLSNTCAVTGNAGAYDTIDQTITTNIGDLYQLSFYYGASLGSPPIGDGSGYYNDVSTNGHGGGSGNAIDILAYANAVSASAPEIDPGSAVAALTLLAGGLMLLRGRQRAF